MTITEKTRLLQSTILGGLLVGFSATAFAQDTSPEAPVVLDTIEEEIEQTDDSEVVVTGSRIKQVDLESASPVTVINAEQIAFSGISSVEELLQEMTDAQAIGPVLVGMKKSIHVLQLGSGVREILDMIKVAVVDAHNKR